MPDTKRPTCETCPYWENDGEYAGECHRFPPRLPSTDRQQNESIVALGARAMWTGWHAATAPSEWCGEHPDFPAWLRFARAAEKTAASPDSDTDIKPLEEFRLMSCEQCANKYSRRLSVRARKSLLRLGELPVTALSYSFLLMQKHCGCTTATELREFFNGLGVP